MQALENARIEQFIQQNPNWHYKNDAIEAEFQFDDFKSAFAFMTRVAFEAEALQHHPEWSNVYNRLNIRLTTHDVGNKVSQKDLDLATRIDALK